MYAIIKTGGKQYKVQAGDVLQIDKIDQDLGAEFNFVDILMIGGEKAHVGAPLVKGATVTAIVTKQARGRKIIVFKKKRRQGYRKFGTHKQHFTEVFIVGIGSPDGTKTKSDHKPVVKDMALVRTERIEQKMADRVARVTARDGDVPAEVKTVKKAAPKKVAVKKAAPKKAASKRSVKKAAAPKKKTTKKTK